MIRHRDIRANVFASVERGGRQHAVMQVVGVSQADAAKALASLFTVAATSLAACDDEQLSGIIEPFRVRIDIQRFERI